MRSKDSAFRDDLRQVGAMREMPLVLDICANATGMGFVAVARVTEDHWLTCASLDHIGFGLLPGDEVDVSSTICQEVRACGDVIVIPDVDASEDYRDHPTPARYGFKSYISVPITRTDGSFWGTLCAIDPQPRALDLEIVAMFQLFAQLIATELDGRDELNDSRASLASERDTARLREEFIAIVGHDLRNPVAAVGAGLRMLGRRPLDADVSALISEMQRSMLRMQQILDNLADFARGRLGAGIELDASAAVALGPIVQGIAHEIEQVSGQPVGITTYLPRPIRCDPQRLGQLLSNLLSNAVSHGDPEKSIQVEASDRDGVLTIAVKNFGPSIPEAVRPSLFLPFSRGGGSGHNSLQGLGLGLYIASEIARAHRGDLTFVSDESMTTFVLTMPTISV